MEHERPARLGKAILACVVPLSALALGSLLPWALALVTVLSALSTVLLWWSGPARLSSSSRFVLVALAILWGATVVQCVPLPAAVVHVLSPATADVWTRAWIPFREAAPAFFPLTLAPAATHLEVLRGCFYVCVFLSALRVMSFDGGRAFLERVVVVSATLVALSSLGHAAVHAERVFGVYAPRDAYAFISGRYGPLLNPNHLSAYLNVGACVALGVVLAQRPSMPPVLAGAAGLLCAGTSVWAGSRGGTGALVLGVGLAFALAWRIHRRADQASRYDAVFPVLVGVAGAGLVGFGTSDFARSDLSNTNLSKFELALASLRLTGHSPFFGVGRGAFETVFPSVQQGYGGPSYDTFTHPENLVAQWSTEWGIPVTLAAFALFGYALRPATMLQAARPPLGAWAAIVASVTHDFVDFHLEVPGVTAPVLLCIALVVGARARSSRPLSLWDGKVRASAFVVAGLSFVVLAFSARDFDHTLAEERARLGKMTADTTVSATFLRSELRRAIERYPAEAFFPLMGAVRHVGGSTMPWLARTLERSPNLGRAHLVLARTLSPGHRAQARLEYRLAYELDVRLRVAALKEAQSLVDDYDSALELVPDGVDGAPVLDVLAAGLSSTKPATAVKLDEELARRSPTAAGPFLRKAKASLTDHREKASWCIRDSCALEGIEAAKELVRRDPGACAPRVLLAELQFSVDRERGKVAALDELKLALDEVEDRSACSREFIRLSLAYGEGSRADLELDRLVRAGCGTASECYDLYTWAARTEESRRNVGRALVLYRRAAELDPDRYDNVEHLGDLAEKTGLYGEAIDVFNQLAHRHPEEPRWAKRVEELRTKALRPPLPAEAARLTP